MRPAAGATVRSARPGDVAAVARLERDCLGRDAWSEALVAEGLAGRLPTVSYLVAETGGQVTGHLAGHAVVSSAGEVAELQRIAVDAAYRRRGVARMLLDAVVQQAARTEADRLLLEVREDNDAALAFYARSGFVEVDRRRRYYRDGATAVVMLMPLPGGEQVRRPG